MLRYALQVPAFLSVVDIAGLVKGANEGQGLGNAFLSHISGCDAIFHMTRAFDDDDVSRVTFWPTMDIISLYVSMSTFVLAVMCEVLTFKAL